MVVEKVREKEKSGVIKKEQVIEMWGTRRRKMKQTVCLHTEP